MVGISERVTNEQGESLRKTAKKAAKAATRVVVSSLLLGGLAASAPPATAGRSSESPSPLAPEFVNTYERVIHAEQGDWTQDEAGRIEEVARKDIELISQVFGPTQKYITEIRIAKLTDELRREWNFPFHEGTTCDPVSGVCTVWVDAAPSLATGVFDEARTSVSHGLVHVWIGGYDTVTDTGQHRVEGYMFGPFVESSAMQPAMAATPQDFFDEESLCFLIDSLTETEIYGAPVPLPLKFDSSHSYYVKALSIDRMFFQEIRDQLDAFDVREGQDLTMGQIASMAKVANPKVAEVLHW